MGTYINFIESVSENKQLAKEFKQNLKHFSKDELSVWFQDKGYSVSSAECGVIMKNMKSNFAGVTLMGSY